MGPLSWAPPGPCRSPFSWHSPPPSQGVDRAGRRVRQHGGQQGAGRTRGGQERGPGSGPGCSGQAAGEGRVSPAPVTWAAPRPAQFRERWHLRAPGQEEGGEGTPPPEAAREMSVQGTAPPASGTRAARGRGVQPTPGDRAASPGRCSRGPPRSTGTPASPCARAVQSNSRPGSAGRKDAVSLGLYRRGSRGLARSLSRGRRRRAGTPAGRRALSPGLPRAGRAPLTAVPPAGRQRPQTREADSPGPPAAGGRQGSPTPDPAPGGVLRGTERRLSARHDPCAHRAGRTRGRGAGAGDLLPLCRRSGALQTRVPGAAASPNHPAPGRLDGPSSRGLAFFPLPEGPGHARALSLLPLT